MTQDTNRNPDLVEEFFRQQHGKPYIQPAAPWQHFRRFPEGRLVPWPPENVERLIRDNCRIARRRGLLIGTAIGLAVGILLGVLL